MSNDIRLLQRKLQRLERELAETRAALRHARGREIARRRDRNEPWKDICNDMGLARQYAHRLMQEASECPDAARHDVQDKAT